MASAAPPVPKLDRYVVIHVATTCDEHGVYVTKDSAEVIEIGWILLDSKTCEEVCPPWNSIRSHSHPGHPLTFSLSPTVVSRQRPRQARQYTHHSPVQ